MRILGLVSTKAQTRRDERLFCFHQCENVSCVSHQSNDVFGCARDYLLLHKPFTSLSNAMQNMYGIVAILTFDLQSLTIEHHWFDRSEFPQRSTLKHMAIAANSILPIYLFWESLKKAFHLITIIIGLFLCVTL